MDTPRDISTLYRKMNIRMNILMTPLGLSSAKSAFLFCIYDHEPMRQTEICQILDMDKSTVTKMLVRLEHDGLITKETSMDDARAYMIRLTNKAKALVPQAKKIHAQWLDQVTSDFTELERQNFYELMEKAAKAANFAVTPDGSLPVDLSEINCEI